MALVDIKTTTAETHLDIYLDCPHCDNYMNVTENLKEFLHDDLRAENIDEIITCDNSECEKEFLVTEITY